MLFYVFFHICTHTYILSPSPLLHSVIYYGLSAQITPPSYRERNSKNNIQDGRFTKLIVYLPEENNYLKQSFWFHYWTGSTFYSFLERLSDKKIVWNSFCLNTMCTIAVWGWCSSLVSEPARQHPALFESWPGTLRLGVFFAELHAAMRRTQRSPLRTIAVG
jgi:hypothetical protein